MFGWLPKWEKSAQSAATDADRLIDEGNRAESQDRLAEACELYRRAVGHAPRYAKAHLNLGAALEANGEQAAALASYERALERDPANPYANYNVGRLQYARGELSRAERLLNEALRARAHFPEARIVLAAVLEAGGQPQFAAPQLEAALRERPQDFAALFRYAAVLKTLGRLPDAQAALQRALSVDPQSVEARGALSDLLLESGQPVAAARELERLLEQRPDWADAHYNYGCVLRTLMRVSEAESALRRAIALEPRHAAAYRMLGSVLLAQCRTAEALELYRAARASCPDDLDLQSAELFALNSSESISDDALYRRHVEFGARLERAYPLRFGPFGNTKDPERRLRIGYVSGDFGYHVMTLFSLPLIERHERAAFEVFCYSTSVSTDDFTRQVAALADAWRPVAGRSQAQIADAIHADGIDILVDLGGHSGIPQLAAFAQCPAPVQVAWLGYLNTTGMTRMRFRISDNIADPPGLTDALHTETLVRLPHSQWCYRSFLPAVEVGPSPLTRNRYVTFGSFNQAMKLSRTSRALWAELLSRLPDARLAVLGVPKGRAQDELLVDLTALGAGAERITLVPYVSLQDYFGWLGAVDIALDTTPYSGGTTTCDALWMGVPVITAPGTRPCSRSTASILASAGLPEWIAPNAAEYVRRAVRFAGERELLAELRGSLRERVLASPLMDEKQFTRDLEQAYREMWRTWCEGNPA